MADQNLTGVTTRELTTGQDSDRAKAIATRSRLATSYTDQFRGDRDSMRRGGVTRNTSGPSVPEAQGDVTQDQDTAVPGSFQDAINAIGGVEGGDDQNANQIINPGPVGGGSGGGGSGGGGSGGSGSGSGSQYGDGSGGGRTGTDANGNQIDGSTADRYWDNENDPIYESGEHQPNGTVNENSSASIEVVGSGSEADTNGYTWTGRSNANGSTTYSGSNSDGSGARGFTLRANGSLVNTMDAWANYTMWQNGGNS